MHVLIIFYYIKTNEVSKCGFPRNHTQPHSHTDAHKHECSRLLCMPYLFYKDRVSSMDAQSSFLQAKRRTEQTPSLQHRSLMTLFEKRGAYRSLLAQPKNLTTYYCTESGFQSKSTINVNCFKSVIYESAICFIFYLISCFFMCMLIALKG